MRFCGRIRIRSRSDGASICARGVIDIQSVQRGLECSGNRCFAIRALFNGGAFKDCLNRLSLHWCFDWW